MISLTRFCAYQFPKNREFQPGHANPWKALRLNPEEIEVFFKADPRLNAPFHRFQANGAEGWLLTDGARWVSYGWVTNCAVFMPPHLGKNIAEAVDWIFFCGTHPDYRGKGAFRALLLEIAKSRMDSGRQLYLDTLPGNAASRRAVENAGFEPRGMMWSLSIRIPKCAPFIWSGWDRRRQHSPIPCR